MKNGFIKALKTITFFAAAALLLQACSQKPIYRSKLQSGETTEKNAFVFDSDDRIYYSVSNTNTELIARLKINDETTIRRILFRGLTVWIDTAGKKKKSPGIEYPLAADQRTRPGYNATGPDGSKPGAMPRDKKEMQRRMLENLQEADLHNFSEEGPDRIIIPDRSGIALKLEFDSAGSLNYTMHIPFKVLHTSIENLTKPNHKPLTLGFTTGKPKRAAGTGVGSAAGQQMGGMGGGGGMGGMGGGGMGGMGGGGMGGMGGGGMGGMGGGGYRGGGGGQAEETVSLWFKVELSKP
ncbi:MAG: hypothetical protein V4543_01245 [Bacteroidota bacterium]